jgi:hypothetical protein
VKWGLGGKMDIVKRKKLRLAMAFLLPFILITPFTIIFVKIHASSDLQWFTLVGICLASGFSFLAKEYRWYSLPMALLYLPIMYFLLGIYFLATGVAIFGSSL